MIRPAKVANLADKPSFEQKDDGKVDEHPSDEEEFSVELVKNFSWRISAMDSYYINRYYSKDVDEECPNRTNCNVDYLSHSGYAGAPEKQHNHK